MRFVSDPAFSDGATKTLSIDENNAAAASVGTVAATDADGDTLTYFLEPGGDASNFTISSTGEIKVASGTTLNREAQASYTVTAAVTDGDDPWGQTLPSGATVVSNIGLGTASTYSMTGPGARGAQIFTTGDNAVGYTLTNIGLRIASWIATAAPTAAIWSTTAAGVPDSLLFTLTNPARMEHTTITFTAPAGARLEPGTAYALVLENSGPGLFRPLATSSDDENSGAASGWSIADDRQNFSTSTMGWSIHSSALQMSVSASEYLPPDDTIAVTINVANVNEPPTAAPTGLAVTGQTSRSLDLSWNAVAAAAGGPAPNGYDFRWFAGSADPTDATDWVEPGDTGGHTSDGTGLTTTLGGLEKSTAYRVQVRAKSPDGPGPWSASVDAMTTDQPDITLSVSPDNVNEGDSATITVTASRVVADNATAVTLRVIATTPEASCTTCAVSGTDYTAFTARQITIGANQPTGTATFTLRTTEDAIYEGNETITLGVQTIPIGFGIVPATITINDDDTPTIQLSFTPDEIAENGSATAVTLKATLVNTATRTDATVVTLATALSGSATGGPSSLATRDYTTPSSLPTMVTIPAEMTSGTATATFSIAPHNNDDSDGDRTIELTGSACLVALVGGSCPAGEAFTVNKAVLTLTDDDAVPIELRLSRTSVAEGDSASVTLTASRATASNADAVTVSLAVQTPADTCDDCAESGTDYTALTFTDLTIGAGQATANRSFTIRTTEDVTFEGNETIVIGGTATGTTTFAVMPVTFTINDDDEESDGVVLILSTTMGSEATSHSVRVTARLNKGASEDPVTVALDLSGTARGGLDTDASRDYTTPASTTITIPEGQLFARKDVPIAPLDDSLHEPDETIIFGAVGGKSGGGLTVNVVTDTFRLTSDDAEPTTIQLSFTPSTIAEDATGDSNGDVAVTQVTATLVGDSTRTDATVVDLASVLSGTATAGSTDDYVLTGSLPTMVTIQTGMSSGSATATFKINPTNNDDSDGNRTIELAGDGVQRRHRPVYRRVHREPRGDHLDRRRRGGDRAGAEPHQRGGGRFGQRHAHGLACDGEQRRSGDGELGGADARGHLRRLRGERHRLHRAHFHGPDDRDGPGHRDPVVHHPHDRGRDLRGQRDDRDRRHRDRHDDVRGDAGDVHHQRRRRRVGCGHAEAHPLHQRVGGADDPRAEGRSSARQGCF